MTRLGYDRAGCLTFSQDPRYGIRRLSYDAARQLIAATNGIGGATRYAYDDRGRLVSITDPLGAVTTRTYTDLDQVAAQTDPLGRVTTAAYDAAGRQIAQTAPDGVTTEWTDDAAGLASGLSVDGRRVTEIRRDPGERSATVVDHTGAETVSHTLRYSRVGRLIERVTGDETTRWEYDADGARTRLVTPTGVTVDYARDAAGRLTRLDHSRLGAVHYTRDAFGRILEARAGDSLQTWDYADGFPVAHTRTDATGATVTRIERDHTGRILAITDATGSTRYLHDEAGQLVSAVTDAGETLWQYDTAGRLVRETSREGERVSTYDAAGQLLTLSDAAGMTTFAYDERGRRVRESAPGHETTYAWDERGWLRGITERASGGQERHVALRVDGLGDLVEVDGIPLLWDTADGTPRALRAGSTDLFRAPGALAGIDGEWIVGGWRDARSAAADEPWAALRAVQALGGGAVSITPGGDLAIAGLEWMGARAYDPTTRGFLTTDPLEAPVGAVWGTNPYSYAGNDPLHATDPLGLRPVTDAELTAYGEARQGALATATDWVGDNWDVILAGAVVVVGVGLMFTGVGGPVGAVLIGAASGALISGGTSYISQKTTTGTVDWGKVGTDTLTGAVSGAVGGGVAAGLARAKDVVRIASFADDAGKGAQNLYNFLRNPINRGMVSGGASGSTGNVLDYQFSDGDHSPLGYLQAGASGLVTGAGGSAISGHLGKGLAEEIAERFPGFVAATTSGRHAAPLNYGSMLAELGVSHVTGALGGLVNTALKPGDVRSTDMVSGLLQGFANGGDGPVVGRWAP